MELFALICISMGFILTTAHMCWPIQLHQLSVSPYVYFQNCHHLDCRSFSFATPVFTTDMTSLSSDFCASSSISLIVIIEVCFLKEELQDIKTFLFHSLGKYKAIHFPSFLNHFDYDLYKTFRQYVGIISWAKVFKKAESTERGQRLWPTGSQDKKLNFRIDKGAKISDTQHEIIIQANKGADDPEVKKSAQKDSHRILAKCTINPKE